jgi:hypothetical protein
MTQFVGNALPQFRLERNDDRLEPQFWQTEQLNRPRIGAQADFATPWWPRSGFVGDLAVDISVLIPSYFERPEVTRGTNSRFGYQGVTRDVNNSPLGNCTVKLFRTSTDEKVATDVTSDPTTGEFIISTPYYEPHYIVTRKTAVPDVGGVSVSTSYPNT